MPETEIPPAMRGDFYLVLMVRSERYRLLGYEADEHIAIGGAYSVDKHFRLARGSG